MKKFITTIALTLCLLLCSGEAIKTRSSLLRRNLAGDLHPKFRKLAELGSNRLRLKVDGKGMFAYRLKTADATTDAGDADESSLNLAADERIAQGYHNAYSAGLPTCTVKAGVDDDGALGVTCTLSSRGKGDATDCDYASTAAPTAAEATAAQCDYAAGSGTAAGSPANKQRPAVDQKQLVYSDDGSLHVNRYGYLVDDNGLLLYGDGEATADSVEDMSIHIPSRAEAIIVTSTGNVLAQENGGAGFANCGNIKLARFANQAGLNIYDRIVSRCAAANKLGFALGNWCAGSELDGKEHIYYEKSALSGLAFYGKPRDLGFGKIVTL
jgi:hypothetical protein